MPCSSYQLMLDGQAAEDDFYTQVSSLEVEENLELPGAFQLQLPVSRTDTGELSFINDIRLRPFAPLSVVATVQGKPTSASSTASCSRTNFTCKRALLLPRSKYGDRTHPG